VAIAFQKDFEPCLTEIYRKIFRMTFFANFAQPFKLEDFCENMLRKNQIFTAGQVSK
jgi:chaperonin GroEL (HSP60 family)